MNRLVVVRCPDLLDEDEGGASLRLFSEVVGTVEVYCPWVTPLRPGICSLPVRGPARYFGGEESLVQLVVAAARGLTTIEVGVADGLFAAVLAARHGAIVPPGRTVEFLAPFPVAILDRAELAGLLDRLGIRTLGQFAALPEAHVLGRFGADGALCHRVAGGQTGEWADFRHPATARQMRELRHRRPGRGGGPPPHPVVEQGFWGGVSDTDTRAERAVRAVQELIGADGVVTPRLQGGRGPAQRARFITWNGQETTEKPSPEAPWPGHIPPPAPALVHPSPLRAQLDDALGRSVAVSGQGLLTTAPARLSVEHSPWSEVTAWAGPWPADERWWARSRHRGARLQAVAGPVAHLLLVERGSWWVEATYG